MKLLRTDNSVIVDTKHKTIKETVEYCVKNDISLDCASLDRASLDRASLVGAFLYRASLDRASLDRASLDRASLVGASLIGASLDRASLDCASLDRASLVGASLIGASLIGASLDRASLDRAFLDCASLDRASLIGASLDRASLIGASLYRANYSILQILKICFSKISDELTLELMRWDAITCGVDKMTDWANNNGSCPFESGYQREFYFQEKKELWKPGHPTMNHRELWEALAKEKEIKI